MRRPFSSRLALIGAALAAALPACAGGGARGWASTWARVPEAISPATQPQAAAAAAEQTPAPALGVGVGAAPAMAPAQVLTPDGAPAAEPTVHALGFDGERFYVNGQAADELAPSRTEGDTAVHALAHPSDETLTLTVFRSPASLQSDDRRRQAVERLAPLSAAGAGPRLVEHGEARVPGRGLVHFLVQEAVKGQPLARLPAPERRGPEAAGLLERLRRAGLALAVPGPRAEHLLEHVVLGETASGGRGAYVVGLAADVVEPARAAAHAAMLRSLLEAPGAGEPPAPNPVAEEPRSEAPAPAAPRDSPSVRSDALEADAAALRLSLDDGTALAAAHRLMEGLADAPAKATAKLHEEVLTGVSEYWAILSKRDRTGHELPGDYRVGRSHYYTPVPLDYRYKTTRAGIWFGAERYSARLDLYRKLLEERPDLAGSADRELLMRAFSTGLFGDETSDLVFLAEQAKLAGALSALAVGRPDLMPIEDYARLLHLNAQAASQIGYAPDLGDLKPSQQQLAAVARLRRAQDEGFVPAARRASLDGLRRAVLSFDGARWLPTSRFGSIVERLGADWPDFAALRRDPAMPVSRSSLESLAASDPTDPALHSLGVGVEDEETLELAVRAAQRGWAAYQKALLRYDMPKARQFYIDVFALGQALGAQSAFGPKVTADTLMAEARRLGEVYLPSDPLLRTALYSIGKDLAGSPNHMRKAALAALLRRFLGLDVEPPKRFWHGDPRMTHMPFDAQHRIVLDQIAKDIPALLKDFDVGAPSNIAGVVLAGSWAEGGADADSDLNLYLLTREGRDRTSDFIEALRKKAASRGWPAIRIEPADVMDAKDPRVDVLRRSVPTVVYSLDETLAAALPIAAPYAGKLSWSERRADEKWRRRLREALEARLK